MPLLPRTFLNPGHIAHRGLHGPGIPENSASAFRAAIARGYAVEMDVQPSRDGVPMAFHDDALDRLTARGGLVDSLSAAELADLPLTGSDAAEGVPTLRGALDLIAGRVPVVVELKDRDGDMGDRVGPLEDAVAEVLRGYRGDLAVMSFNPHTVGRLADLLPEVPRGLVTSDFRAGQWPGLSPATRERLAGIPDFDRVGASFVSHQADALAMPRIAALKARGVPILCWTIPCAGLEAMVRRVADAVTFEGYLP
ncbi:glycerophosphodiester phosphodiesterase family protein [Jannaschia sp. LMIT008]|uniref:glycerophosphodiester phosphodiesterase family protein n=1 Tax=Jannaschia maritima TaxID=3032585 RepID=UPI0028128CBE|nr:glycerophosphodiester phosphodiesterase family protein [Jannaschia sp. LMIT008]